MPRRALLPILTLLSTVACSEPSAGPVLKGQWGGHVASLQLADTGGSVQYQCGSGTIKAGWTFTDHGAFQAQGEHFFGGGPVPPGGAPGHPATYTGHVVGPKLVLTVTLTDLDQVLGPFELVRDGPQVADMCL